MKSPIRSTLLAALLTIASALPAATPAQAAPSFTTKQMCFMIAALPLVAAVSAYESAKNSILACVGSDDARRTFEDAKEYCAKDGMRLPTALELARILNLAGLSSEGEHATTINAYSESGELQSFRYDNDTYKYSEIQDRIKYRRELWTSSFTAKGRQESAYVFEMDFGYLRGKPLQVRGDQGEAYSLCVKDGASQ